MEALPPLWEGKYFFLVLCATVLYIVMDRPQNKIWVVHWGGGLLPPTPNTFSGGVQGGTPLGKAKNVTGHVLVSKINCPKKGGSIALFSLSLLFLSFSLRPPFPSFLYYRSTGTFPKPHETPANTVLPIHFNGKKKKNRIFWRYGNEGSGEHVIRYRTFSFAAAWCLDLWLLTCPSKATSPPGEQLQESGKGVR